MFVKCESVGIKFKRFIEKEKLLRWTLINFLKGKYSQQVFWALKDITFSVRPGETFGIIGANGSGKSTLLKLIAGILKPDTGKISIGGKVSALLELGAGFHPELTGRENIFLNASLLGFTKKEIKSKFDDIVKFAELENFIDTPVKHYSSGMYMRLGFSIAIHLNPEILLIDEVLAVGDKAFQDKCLDKIFEFKRLGKTIIFVSHDLPTVKKLCKRAIWLNKGKISAIGITQKVIDYYMESISKQKEEELQSKHCKILEDIKNRWGSKTVEITEVKFLDKNFKEKFKFKTNEDIYVKIKYLAKEKIEKPVFGVAIFRSDGVHINGPNTKLHNKVIDYIEGEGELLHIIKKCPLLPGTYYFSVAVYDYNIQHPFDHHDKLYTFVIEEGGTREIYGCVQLDTDWIYL